MKKLTILFIGLVLFFLAAPAKDNASAPAPAAPATGEITLAGVIIDNLCAGAQKPEELAKFVRTHSKECALMPRCAASGYALFTDGKLRKFDQKSSARIEEFLKKPESKLTVTAIAKKVDEHLQLISIKNRE